MPPERYLTQIRTVSTRCRKSKILKVVDVYPFWFFKQLKIKKIK